MYVCMYVCLDLPKGAEWMIRGAYTTSLRVQAAPFGRCWCIGDEITTSYIIGIIGITRTHQDEARPGTRNGVGVSSGGKMEFNVLAGFGTVLFRKAGCSEKLRVLWLKSTTL